jgi:hypothetical protein
MVHGKFRRSAGTCRRPTLEILEDRLAPSIVLGQQPGAPNNTTFHGDSLRTGFDNVETVLTPANVASSFGQLWQSPTLDGAIYATPLYLDSLLIAGPGNAANHAGDGIQNASFQNKTLGVVFAATGGGSVYAIAAQDTNGPTGIAPGTILWKTHVGNPYAGVDGNSIGVLGTPIIDLASGRIYVTASVTDYLSAATDPNHGKNNFEVFALSIHDGSLISGWPLIYTQALLDTLNQDTLQAAGVAVPFSSGGADQRGALNLSPDASILYVDWACYGASNPGWMTTVATGMTNGAANGQAPAIVSAYSSVDTIATNANGGMWGAGGPAVDASGNVFVTTGDSPGGTGNPAGDWGNSLLEFAPGQTLTLVGVYSPWNYPTQDTIDSDLGGGSPILINLPTGSSTTTELVAFGGKQGNGYLADAGNHLNNPTANPNGSPAAYPAGLTARPPGGLTPDQDASLYDTTSTGVRSYWQGFPAQDGPLSLFGPYNESSASGNTAKARDAPATFTGPDGSQYVIFAGSSKAGVGSSTPVAPSLFLTKIVHSAGQPAYLQIVAQNNAVMSNPGANLITGNGGTNEIDWIVDAGVQRSNSLTSYANGDPVLYAYNALTMQPLWSSAYEELSLGGKYNSIAVARGNVFVGTHSIQAFGLNGDTIVDDAVSGTGNNQFNYVGSGWMHITGSSTMGTFDATVSTDNVQGDYATLTFVGSQIKVYADEVSGYGTATFSVDGGNTQTVALSPANSSPNGAGAGDVLVYTISGLGPGTHIFKILNNAASNIISLDRVEITPATGTPAQLGISLTDGNILPPAQGAVPYTINYNDAGSIFSSAGVNASGAVLIETVPANTSADLANSTPGWTLTSGSGGPGSTYTFTVGNLNAGVTGSVVFSLDLAANIPPGTTSITDTVLLADAAGDHAAGSRTTPIPSPVESKLVFTTEPPATGSAGIPLSPPIVVAAVDQFNNIYTADSSSSVTLTLNGGTFVGGGMTVTVQLASGVANFSNLQISAAGTYTLTARDGGLTSAASSSFTIAASSMLAFTQQPSQTVASVAMSPSAAVAVESAGGGVITTDNSTITLTLSRGAFANGSTTMTAQAVNGLATFTGLTIDVAGSYNLIASDGSLPTRQSNPFNIVAQATQLVFTQQPNNTVAGEAVNPSVLVALEDRFGNVDTSNSTTVTVTLNGGKLFGGATSASAVPVNGVAAFNNLVLPTPGTYSLTTSASGLTSATSYYLVVGSATLTTIDDNNANNTGSIPQVVYSTPVTNWVLNATSLANNYGGTVTSDSTGGDTATVAFTGTLITLYAVESPTGGVAQIFIDGNAPTQVSLVSSTAMIAPVYTSPLLTAGSHTIEVKVVSGTVAIDHFVVGPATPTLAWATPANLTYGTALDPTELDAYVTNSAGFPGTFSYSPAAGTILPVGANQPLTVTFTPTDKTDYVSASAEVLITVVKATPLITWTGPKTPMTFGQALGPAQLNATATVNGTPIAGSFVYLPAAGTVPPTGASYLLTVTFAPSDTTDYNSVTAQESITVNPATPTLTWFTPADIIDGTALTATQLDATANVPGIFAYAPAAGTVLAPGQHQALSVVFTPADNTDYTTASAAVYLNVDYGPAAKLAFLQQPTPAGTGKVITPAVTVAVEDAAGKTIPTDSSTVILTLSVGTFTSGANSVSAAAVNGVATFSSLALTNNGQYTLTATDGSLTSAVSDTFAIGTTAFDNFNGAASTFTSQFATNLVGKPGGSSMTWGTFAGIDDQAGSTAGGGIIATSGDENAIYTKGTFNISDGAVHTVSEFLTWTTTGTSYTSGDRLLQIGFVTSSTGAFNAGLSFISARILGNRHVEFQSGNGSGTSAISKNNTAPTGTIASGDWLELVFTTQETASGSFQGTFSLLDYGPTGLGVPTLVLAPVSYTVTGLTTIGTASTMYAGFRTATGGGNNSLAFDNFLVDSTAAKMVYLQQPSSGYPGVALGSFVAAVEDINSNVLVGDTSTVTLTLSHGAFASGQTTASAQAVDGLATFTTLVINTPDSYILRATDTNPNLDPGYAPFNIVPATLLLMPGTGTTGAPNSTLKNYPVSINQLVDVASSPDVGLASANLVLTYPTGVFNFPVGGNLATPDVSLGSVPLSDKAGAGGASDWILTANSPADGLLNINLTAKTGDNITANTGGGSLILINFPILPAASLGNATLTLINNSSGHTQITGNNGIYTLSPAPPYTGNITIAPGPLAQYFVSVPAGPAVTAGKAFLMAVQAADQFGNLITNYTGPATVTATISPASGSSSFPMTVAIGSNGLGLALATLKQAGTYTITVASGSFKGSAAPVTVSPGSAVGLAFSAQPANTPTGIVLPTVSVQVVDLYGNVVTTDSSDVVTLSVGSGPGAFTSGSTTSAMVQNGVTSFANLVLVAPGSYTLAAQVPGRYTSPNSVAFTVAPLQVVPGSFQGTPDGFSLKFNTAFLVTSTTLVLYGPGFGAAAPAPSVLLTTDPGNLQDSAAMVEGSLVLNPATDTIMFVATDTALEASNGSPILPDGTYTAILRSSAATDGFQALNPGAGFLDGLDSGVAGSGDFTATFTVSASHADVVWVPATADGPGQALSAPGQNQANLGYPIYLKDSTGTVTSVLVTLNYNPALLSATGVSGAGLTLLGSSTPGKAILQYSGPALKAGSQAPIGYLLASVSAGTSTSPVPYRAEDLLHLTNVSLNGGGVPVVAGDALHLVAYVGDADGSGSYSSNDAVLITRVALQSDRGFSAYPLVDPVMVADTDGSGFIPADAALQVNEAGVGYPTTTLANPPIPAGVHFQAAIAGAVSLARTPASQSAFPPRPALLPAVSPCRGQRSSAGRTQFAGSQQHHGLNSSLFDLVFSQSMDAI